MDNWVSTRIRSDPRHTYRQGVPTMSRANGRRQAKEDPKGDRRSRSISSEQFPIEVTPLEVNARCQLDSDALESLGALCCRGDGWIRITATLDMHTVYLKYKWTSGPNRGKYVMAVGTLDQLAWAVCLLHNKAQQVDKDELRASQDTFYDWKD